MKIDPWQFLVIFKEKITLHDRGKDFPEWATRWYATFSKTSAVTNCCERGTYGNGHTPATAIVNLFSAFNAAFNEGLNIRVGNETLQHIKEFRVPSLAEVKTEYSLD